MSDAPARNDARTHPAPRRIANARTFGSFAATIRAAFTHSSVVVTWSALAALLIAFLSAAVMRSKMASVLANCLPTSPVDKLGMALGVFFRFMPPASLAAEE